MSEYTSSNESYHLPKDGTPFTNGDRFDLHLSQLQSVDAAREQIRQIVSGSLAEQAVNGVRVATKAEIEAKNAHAIKIMLDTGTALSYFRDDEAA